MPSLLFVDDDPDMHVLVQALLSEQAMVVHSAGSYADAMAQALKQAPDILLIDNSLDGEQDGVQLLRALREAEVLAPAVMLTADRRRELDQAALEAGFVDFLVKSELRPLSLERTLRFALERDRMARERDMAHARVARIRDDLQTVIDHLRVGVLVVDGEGRVRVMSAAAGRLLGVEPEDCEGLHWSEVGSFRRADVERIRAMYQGPPEAREKVPISLTGSHGRGYHVDVEVWEDPRDSNAQLVLLYDVSEVHDLRLLLDERPQFQSIIGRSGLMAELFQQIRDLAAFDTTVLIEGETGTGKELVAKAIHARSVREAGPFVAVNCAGLTESLLASQLFGHKRDAFTGATEDHAGYFEEASGGTLFLDELGDMPAPVQTSLLRTLQEGEIMRLGDARPRKVDVRVIAATHQDLPKLVERGRFRADLLYRIRVARLHIPPLRERPEDIPLLAATFLADLRTRSAKAVTHIDPRATSVMLGHDWPGNVRELKSAIEYAYIRCKGPVILPAHLPPELPKLAPGRSTSPDAARERIEAAIEAAGGNRSKAAKMLGISRATFYRRLQELKEAEE